LLLSFSLFYLTRRPPRPTLFPYTTLFRSSPVKPATRTFGRSAVAVSSMPRRSSGEKKRLLETFTPAATITSSKSPAARRTMSRWPLVTGSYEPGQTARRTCRSSSGDGGRLGGLLRRGVTVPKRGLPVLLLAPGLEAVGPGQRRSTLAPFHHHERLRHEPPVGNQGDQIGLD